MTSSYFSTSTNPKNKPTIYLTNLIFTIAAFTFTIYSMNIPNNERLNITNKESLLLDI